MEVVALVATIAAGAGAVRRPVLWFVPVGLGALVAAGYWAGGDFDGSGNHVALSMVIVASYLAVAGIGWFVATAARQVARARRSSPG